MYKKKFANIMPGNYSVIFWNKKINLLSHTCFKILESLTTL